MKECLPQYEKKPYELYIFITDSIQQLQTNVIHKIRTGLAAHIFKM